MPVISAGAKEKDVRGVHAWFLHAPAGADHAGGPTMMIDPIRVSCGYRPARRTAHTSTTTHPGADLPPRPRRHRNRQTPVGAELAIHGGDLRHLCPVAVGHDRRSWRYDCCI
jgi:hypothetical protein